MMKPAPHINEAKRKEVEDVKRLLKEYTVLGVVNLQNLPAFNYMKIKYSLRGKIVLKYTKKRFMKIAFDESTDTKLTLLKNYLVGIPALLFTNEDPFRLAQVLKKSKSNAPAKPGDIAPVDIIIPAGPTEFTPGPMIGELGALGIKTQVMEGKIHIKLDKLLVKAGEVITEKNATLMGKLKMEPMSIGFNLVVTYQNGELLEGQVLQVDVEDYENNVSLAVGESMNLALFIGYVSKDTIEQLIMKATREKESLLHHSSFLKQLEHISKEHHEKKEHIPVTEAHKDIGYVGIGDINQDMIKKAGDFLKELTDKKIRGEL